MAQDSSKEDILRDLKKGALMTNRLSDVHVKTLQTAPFIFFDDVEKVEISYDFAPEGPQFSSRVSFKLIFKNGNTQMDRIEDRVLALIKTTKHVMWENTEISIFDQSGRDLKSVRK